jgi:tRNA(Ile)-lysidine synthase
MPHVRSVLARLGVARSGGTLVLGLSGGPDSVALLDVLTALQPQLGFRLVAGHLDHGLRADSQNDVDFCAALCARLGVPFESARADVQARRRRDHAGLEDAARRERRAFLTALCARHAAEAIALAHTRDDQAETLLLHLLRGAGLQGLRGMLPLRGPWVRPLLDISRAEVLSHLAARALPCLQDPTNSDPALLRNRVRLELLPLLEQRFNPAVRAALARSAALLSDDANTLAGLVDGVAARALRRDGAGLRVDGERLRAEAPSVARGLLRQALAQAGGLDDVAAVHVERLLALARSAVPSGRRLNLPGGREALLRFGDLYIGPRRVPAAAFALPLPVPGRVALPGGRSIVAWNAGGPAVSNGDMAIVPVPIPPAPPLAVRTRLPGDRVRARGRRLSLKRLLIERRVPADQRPDLALVASGNEVFWVPGLTLDAPATEPGRPCVRLHIEGVPGTEPAPGVGGHAC